MKISVTITRLLLVVLWTAALTGTAGQAFFARAEAGSHNEAAVPQAALTKAPAYDWHTFHPILDSSVGISPSLAVDIDGNVYLTGRSVQTTVWGTPLHAYSGGADILVMKLSSQGEYLWHTYFGAAPDSGNSGVDVGLGIAVDASGNVYVTGYSTRSWQGPESEDPLAAHGGDDIYMFTLKLNSDGAYQWHTFFQYGRAYAIAVDDNSVYVTGHANAEWKGEGGGQDPIHEFTGNLVVLKLASSSGDYQWHTYYGAGESAAGEAGYGLVVDASRGMVYLTGSAPDTWLGDGDTPPLNDFSGEGGAYEDIVVLKLDSNGNYQWHTFYGVAERGDVGYGIAVDGQGNPYISGEAFESWGSPLNDHSGERDLTILKLDYEGNYLWHTFYGSGEQDQSPALAVDSSGNAYITGYSSGSWQGDQDSSPAHAYTGLGDIVVLKLNANGAYQWHTFYGAAGNDSGISIAVDGGQNVYLAGTSTSTWQGDGGVPPLNPHNGPYDNGFVLKLKDQEPLPLFLPLVVR